MNENKIHKPVLIDRLLWWLLVVVMMSSPSTAAILAIVAIVRLWVPLNHLLTSVSVTPSAFARSRCSIPCFAITSNILLAIATQKSTCLLVSVGVVLRMASIIWLVFIYPNVFGKNKHKCWIFQEKSRKALLLCLNFPISISFFWGKLQFLSLFFAHSDSFYYFCRVMSDFRVGLHKTLWVKHKHSLLFRV